MCYCYDNCEVVKHMQNFSESTTLESITLVHMVATLTGIYLIVNDE